MTGKRQAHPFWPAMKGDQEKCLEAGANDYLAKLVDVDWLFSMLGVWLYQ